MPGQLHGRPNRLRQGIEEDGDRQVGDDRDTQHQWPWDVRPGDDHQSAKRDQEGREDHSGVDDHGADPVSGLSLEPQTTGRTVGMHPEPTLKNLGTTARTLSSQGATKHCSAASRRVMSHVVDYRRSVIADEVARLRLEYETAGLVESEMAEDPFAEFASWFEGAVSSGIDQPNAFVLATVGDDGMPGARAVLMKDFSTQGLTFYTGLDSEKSHSLQKDPRAAATFVWVRLHRQVRFQGSVSPVEEATADAYFASRPRGAQIGAHASHQGEIVQARDVLDKRYARFEEEFADGPIPRPTHWGGWLIRPSGVEFWQGQANRFHDRVRYRIDGDVWLKERLAP